MTTRSYLSARQSKTVRLGANLLFANGMLPSGVTAMADNEGSRVWLSTRCEARAEQHTSGTGGLAPAGVCCGASASRRPFNLSEQHAFSMMLITISGCHNQLLQWSLHCSSANTVEQSLALSKGKVLPAGR